MVTRRLVIDKRSYSTHYPVMLELDETLIDRNPLIKRRRFFHDPRFFEYNAADLPRALSILAKTSDYDPELIWRNIVRQAELRTLNTNAALHPQCFAGCAVETERPS